MKIIAVIPALNEEKTVANVIRVARSHPDLSGVVMVDSKSTDNTVAVSKKAGAKILVAPKKGKAQVMDFAVENSPGATHFLFLDSDLLGFRKEHISLLLEQVQGETTMAIGVRDRGAFWTTLNKCCLPYISGERVVPKKLWSAVPKRFKQGFKIELALNYTARRLGMKIVNVPLSGLHVVRKEQKKAGFWRGFKARIRMIRQLVAVTFELRLYYKNKKGRR